MDALSRALEKLIELLYAVEFAGWEAGRSWKHSVWPAWRRGAGAALSSAAVEPLSQYLSPFGSCAGMF